MPCLLGCIAMLAPRLLMVFILLLTTWFGQAYESVVWPLLGFFFMPYTTLAYMAAVINTGHHVSGLWLALIVTAALIDLGHWGGSGISVRKRRIEIRIARKD